MCLITAFYDTLVNNCSICCKAAVSPCLKPLPLIPIRGQIWHYRVAPSQLHLPSCAWHPKWGQRTDPTGRSGKFSGWQQAVEGRQRNWNHCGGRLLHIIKPSYPVQALWRSNTPIHLNPSSSSFGQHGPSPSVYSSVQNCVSKGGGDLSLPACPAQGTVRPAAGAFYWNRGCMCYVMGTSYQKVDH